MRKVEESAMPEPTKQPDSNSPLEKVDQKLRSVGLPFYFASIVVVALLTFGIMILWGNITERKIEARQTFVKLVNIDENTIDPEQWGKNFPRQYDSYKRTVDIVRTRHGGSEAFQKLDEDPRWRVIFD